MSMGGGPVPSTTTPPQLAPEVVQVLQQLVPVVQQLVGILQAQQGTSALGGGAPGSPSQSPVQSPVQSPIQHAGEPASFRVASFNTLGASHTAGGKQHPGWRSGTARTPGMIKYLTDKHVDVAGLQEFQGSQQAAFKAAKTGYDMYTKGANSIVWKSDTFRKVSASSVKIPYFNGHEVDMPVVQLEHKATGKRAWFVNIHNPADTADFHNQGGYRAEGLQREQALLAKLRATGLPVYLVGDFNDSTKAKRAITADGKTTSAAGSSTKGIDWIFGTGGAQFTSYDRDRSPTTTQVSDHPIVVASTTI
jgi:endonuclease/exonuclease/phosphatase family metal-dependent hydrolase